MKLTTKTKSTKSFKLELSKRELDAVALAVALMLQNEYTHPNWIKKLEPIYGDMAQALNLDADYNL